jgi:hypothetical protein
MQATFKDISRYLIASMLYVSGAARDDWRMNQGYRNTLGMHSRSEDGGSAWDILYDTTE